MRRWLLGLMLLGAAGCGSSASPRPGLYSGGIPDGDSNNTCGMLWTYDLTTQVNSSSAWCGTHFTPPTNNQLIVQTDQSTSGSYWIVDGKVYYGQFNAKTCSGSYPVSLSDKCSTATCTQTWTAPVPTSTTASADTVKTIAGTLQCAFTDTCTHQDPCSLTVTYTGTDPAHQ